VTSVAPKSTLTIGLPFAFWLRLILPFSFSMALAALSSASSARIQTAVQGAKTMTSAAPVRVQCVVFISGHSLVSTALSAGRAVGPGLWEFTLELRLYRGKSLVITAKFRASVSEH